MLTRPSAPRTAIDRLAEFGLAWGEGVYGRFAATIGAVMFALYIMLTAATSWFYPDANWDMLPYLAVAEESTFPDPQALHDFTYGTVKAGVSEGQYRALVDDGGGYRSHMAQNAVDFHSMLSMYRVKFLYAEVLSVVSKVMPPVKAMHAVQVFSVLFFGLVTLLWLHSVGALAFAPLIAAVLMASEFGFAARASTPDLLCAALFMAGLFAYMRGREAATAVLLFLAFLARPDNIVFLAIFAVLLVAFRQKSWGALVGFGASFVAYLAISKWAGHPGWWPHLWFSSIEQQTNMNGFSPAFSIAVYLKAFAAALVRSIEFSTWVGVAIAALAGWYVTSRAGFKLDRRAGILFAALVLGVLAKFTVFPMPDSRIYFPNLVPPFLLIAAPLMALVQSRVAEPVRSRRLS